MKALTMAKLPAHEYVDAPQSDARLVDGVQDSLARARAAEPQQLDPIPLTLNQQELARGAETSKALLAQSGVNPAEFSPTTLQTFGAYFRTENTIGSLVSSKTLAETLFPTPDSPQMTTDEVATSVEQAGLGPYLQRFSGVRTVADYAAVRDDLKRQMDDAQIQAAATGFTGTAAALAAGIIDLPTLLPGSVGFKAGAKGLTLLEGAAGVAGGAVLGASVAELALQASQVNRSWETSAASVGGSVILGGMLGTGIQAVARRQLGNSIVDTVSDRLERMVSDIAQGSPDARSAGAAGVSAYEAARASGIDSFKPVSSHGFNESLGALGKIKGFVGQNLRIPMLDLNTSKSTSALAARQQLTFMPQITQGDVAGNAVKGPTVNGIVKDFREDLVSIVDVEQQTFAKYKSEFADYADFDKQVARALVNPTAAAHHGVTEVAKRHRVVYTKVLDALIESKVLPKEVKELWGENYFPMIFNGDAIRARPAEFKGVIAKGFEKAFVDDANAAIAEHAQRAASNEATKAKLVGVVEKVGATDDAGQPIINPKTGKQRQTTKVLTEGEQLERDRISKEQHDLEVAWQKEHQQLALDTHDADTRDILAKINSIYDENLTTLRREGAELLDRAARSTTDTPAQRARAIREINAEQTRQSVSVEAERRAAAKDVGTQRGRERAAIEKQYKDAIAEAKVIRDDALGLSKKTANEALDEALVGLRDGIEGVLKYTQDVGGKKVVNMAKVQEDARALGAHWYDSTTGWNRHTLDHEMPGFTDFLKKRRTPVDHEALMDMGFVRSHASSILEDYTRMAGTDAAIATVFKKSMRVKDPITGKVTKDSDLVQVGDLKLGSVRDDIAADYDALRRSIFDSPEFKAKETALEAKYKKLADKSTTDTERQAIAKQFQDELAVARGKVEAELADQQTRDLLNLESMVNAIRGTPGGNSSASWRAGAEVLGHVNHMRLMGGSVISSLTDPIKIAIATGLGNTVKGGMMAYQQLMAKAWSKANAAEKGMSRAGAAALELVLNERLASMSDVVNPHRVNDPLLNMMRKASNTFSKLSGITYWNAFAKQVSENATTLYLGQLAHTGWDGLKKSEQAWLTSLGVNRDGLQIIQDAHLAQKGDKFYDDWPLMDHEKWPDREAARLIRHALAEETQNHVVTPQTIDKMSFATTPTGKVIFQFRQHMVSNQMRFVGRQTQLAGIDAADGDLGRVAAASVGFVGLVMTGALVDFLKQVTRQTGVGTTIDRSKSPFERQAEEWSATPGMALYNALDRSDTMGIFAEASNILDKTLHFGPKTAFTAFDDPAKVKEASRVRNRSLADVLGGPSLGLVNDAVTAAGVLRKAVTGQHLSRGDFRGAERLIPGQNAPVIQQLFNTFERHVGDVYSWPNPK